MQNDESYQRGVKLLEKMVGEDRLDAACQAFSEISPDFEQYVLSFLAGKLWRRPGLDLKTRSLITIAAVTAMGRTRSLQLNIEMAAQRCNSARDNRSVSAHGWLCRLSSLLGSDGNIAKEVFEKAGSISETDG